jgi:vitamin B12 transporter
MFFGKKVQVFARMSVAFMLQSSSVLAVAFMLQPGSMVAKPLMLEPSSEMVRPLMLEPSYEMVRPLMLEPSSEMAFAPMELRSDYAFSNSLYSIPPRRLGSKSDTVTILEEVEVSAPKLAGKLARTGKVVTLIPAEQIRASLGKSLGELLQEQVGISVVGARSAPGSNQEIYVRGANTGHVLLLMDGFPLNDPSHISQAMDWNLINLANIQKIEIIKGGQSTLYGSDAMSAVINLVSKKSDKNANHGSLLVQGGGFGTYSSQLQVNTRVAKNKLGISLQNYSTDGFSAAKDSVKKGENDGMRQQTLSLTWARPIGKRSLIDVNYQALFYQGNLDAGPFMDDKDYTSKAKSSSIRFQWQYQLKHGDLFIRGFQDVIDRVFRNDSTYIPLNAWSKYSESTYKGVNQGAEVYLKGTFSKQIDFVVGAEYKNQATQQSDFSISTYGRYDSPKLAENIANQSIFGTYLTLQKEWNSNLGLEIGARWNRQSTFGDFSTVNVNPYWKYSKLGKAFFNFYTSFKTPSLYQLFSPYGNISLKPEQGKTFELGFEQSIGDFHTRLVGFQNEVKDGIVFQSIDVEPYGKYGNVSQQTTRGLEAELSFSKNKWTAHISYTYLKGTMFNKVDGKDSTYSSLIRRPTNQLQARVLFRAHSKLNFSLLAQFVGERKDYFYDESTYSTVPKVLKSYVWTELQVGLQISQNLNASLMVKNILGQEIVELYGYTGQARNMQASLLWTF